MRRRTEPSKATFIWSPLEAGAQGTLGEAASALGQPMEIDIRRVEMNAHFQQALSDLDEFIRKNFKPEEVQAAQSSRWR